MLTFVCINISAQTSVKDKIDSTRFPRLTKPYMGMLDSTNIPLIATFPVAILTSNAANKIDEIRNLNPDIIIINFTNPKIRTRGDLINYPIFPNWIVYTTGSFLTDSLSDDNNDTILYVVNALKFRAPSTNDTNHVFKQIIRVDNEFMEIATVDTIVHSLTVTRFDTILSTHPAGSRVRSLLSRWPNIYEMNISPKCPLNGSNKQFADYSLNMLFNATLNAKNNDSDYVFDGAMFDMFADVFSDVTAAFTVQDGSQDLDLDMDGIADNPDSVNLWWHNGIRNFVERIRDTLESINRQDFILTCNDQAVLYDLLNGRFFEQFPYNPTIGCCSYGGWKTTMQLYGQWMDTSSVPLPRFSCFTGGLRYGIDSVNYDYHRLALASCLMYDGFYSFDNGDKDHNSFWWYDEYSVDTTGVSTNDTSCMDWLGYPLGNAIQIYADTVPGTGIWTRNFQNGMALVAYLPKNDSVFIQLDTMYYRILGITNTNFNDGSGPFDEVTIIASPAVGVQFENNTIVGLGVVFYKKKSIITSENNIAIPDEFDILISPNPASNIIYVDTRNILSRKNIMMEIYSTAGALVKKQRLEKTENVIDISGLSTGTFIVKIISDKKIFVQKLEIIK